MMFVMPDIRQLSNLAAIHRNSVGFLKKYNENINKTQ